MTPATSDHLLDRIVGQGLRAARLQAAPAQYVLAHATHVRLVARRLMANALAAGDSPLLRVLAPSARGHCTSLATGIRTSSPEQAAAANAAAITITQCDEGLRESRGHPGLHSFAAALAVVEDQDGTIADLLLAMTAGWEIGARLGLVLGPTRQGVHPHGGWGAGAAAAAAAVALGLDDEKVGCAVANALTVGLAGPDSSTYAGDQSHYMLPALGTANGVTAARLAASGLCSPASSLNHFARVAHRHLVASNSPNPTSDRSLMTLAYFKPVGICAHALTSWETASQLGRSVASGDVASVTVRTYAAAARLASRAPTTRLGRQFSIPWAVASGLAGTEPELPSGGVVQSVAAVTSIEHDPALDLCYPATRPAYVTLFLRSGRRLEGFAELHRGDRERPLSEAEQVGVDARLLDMADDPGRAQATFEALAAEGTTRLREITRLATNTKYVTTAF